MYVQINIYSLLQILLSLFPLVPHVGLVLSLLIKIYLNKLKEAGGLFIRAQSYRDHLLNVMFLPFLRPWKHFHHLTCKNLHSYNNQCREKAS